MAKPLAAAIPKGPTAVPRIGDWLVRPAANEIARDDEIVRLEPKAMEVLLFLAGQAGEVVSRDALLSAVWPGTTVGDDALTQAVIKLRKALGDTSRGPQYIETISKRGYRLIAAVDRHGGGAAGREDAVAPRRPVDSRSWRRSSLL
jgi:transcriptional activator of cad operon